MNSDVKKTIDANISVHNALVISGEYEKSPHFFPENQEKVSSYINKLIEKLEPKTSSRRMLDIGCGTGFMINLCKRHFEEIHGLDASTEMMSKIKHSEKVILHEGNAECLPFEEASMDFVTAYSFLDHLFNYKNVFNEVYKVLKTNGVFYSGLNPNRYYSYELMKHENHSSLPSIIKKEIDGMLHNGSYYEKMYGINPDILNAAEPVKSIQKGFLPEEVIDYAKQIGFTEAYFEYDWFLGQATTLHNWENGPAETKTIERYLKMTLPTTRGLFKYLTFVLKK